VVNPTGHADSLPGYAKAEKIMVDVSKAANLDLPFVLAPLTGLLKLTVVPPTGGSLIAGYGKNIGLPGAALLITKVGENSALEFLTTPLGKASISLGEGTYGLQVQSQGAKKFEKKNIHITDEVLDLGNLQLESGGVVLSGSIRNVDGTSPSKKQVAQLIAIDSSKNIYPASLTGDAITETVDSYSIPGLTGDTKYTLAVLDELNRPQVLADNFLLPNQNTKLDLTFTISEPKLVASLYEKKPNGVEALFSCNQSFWKNPDGTSDAVEFGAAVTVKGIPKDDGGSLAFNSLNNTRNQASYSYTRGTVPGVTSLKFSAKFTTTETNPKTGTNWTVSKDFIYPIGLAYLQSDNVSNFVGGEFKLPDASKLSFPANAFYDDEVLAGFQAGALDQFVGPAKAAAASATSGTRAMALASQLGEKAYPPSMFKAIQALADTPNVNPLSSFYDIFLPAGVKRTFATKPTLTLKYDDTADPTKINVYYFNEAQGVYTLENNDRRIDTANRTISVSIGHASVFTVLASSASIIRGGGYTGELEVFNFPNPFDLTSKTVTLQNPGSSSASQTIHGTMIKFNVPSNLSGDVKIEIYNVAGELVRTLQTNVATGGSSNYLEWDGTNDSGADVASGIYIGRFMISGAQEKFLKMAVLK
jgi:hypothetical protein